jgi:ribosomal protein S18 acetylase RimI-like enzyme
VAVEVREQVDGSPADSQVSLRIITPDDESFVREVYASTRDAEMAIVDWDDATKAAFIDQQFRAQSVHYGTNYPDGRFDLVLVDGEPIGRLYVQRTAEQVMLLDIAILAAHRNRGVGTRLVRELMAEAAQSGRPLRLHVEMFNHGARRLYDRLGFVPVEERGLYVLMEWIPERGQASTGGRSTT